MIFLALLGDTAAGGHHAPGSSARRDAARIRKATGKEVGAVYMPAQQSGSPMTYIAAGKQHIVVAVSTTRANTSRSELRSENERRSRAP